MGARLVQRLEEAWWKDGGVTAYVDELRSRGLNPDDMRWYVEKYIFS
jgi:hypothetical protein